MQTISEFCCALGDMEDRPSNWLHWINEKLRHYRPKILVSRLVKDMGFDRMCWISVDFFKSNSTHAVEISGYKQGQFAKIKSNLKMQFSVRDTGVIKAAQLINCLDLSTVGNYADDLNPDLAEGQEKKPTKSKQKQPKIEVPETLPKLKHHQLAQQALSQDPTKHSFQVLQPIVKTKYMATCNECIESDYVTSKMTAVVDKVSQMQAIKDTLLHNKVFLIELFAYLQTKTLVTDKMYPKVSKQSILEFLHDFGIIDDVRISEMLEDILFKSMQSRLQMRADAGDESSRDNTG